MSPPVRLAALCGAVCGPCVCGYRMHPIDEPVVSWCAPVAGKQCPGYDLKFQFACSRSEPWVAPAEGRAKKFRRRVECRSDGIVAATEFVSRLRGRRPEQIRMRVCVIAHDVASRHGFAEKFGMLACVPADDEKRRAQFVTIEEVEELRRHRRVRAVIESDGELARRICMSDCGTENF